MNTYQFLEHRDGLYWFKTDVNAMFEVATGVEAGIIPLSNVIGYYNSKTLDVGFANIHQYKFVENTKYYLYLQLNKQNLGANLDISLYYEDIEYYPDRYVPVINTAIAVNTWQSIFGKKDNAHLVPSPKEMPHINEEDILMHYMQEEPYDSDDNNDEAYYDSDDAYESVVDMTTAAIMAVDDADDNDVN